MRPLRVHACVVVLASLSSSSIGCSGLVPMAAPQRSGAVVQGAPQRTDAPRARVSMANDRAEAAMDEILDRQEKAALKALNKTLGKEPAAPGAPLPESSSTTALALRKSPIKVRVEPVTDADGNALMGDNFFQLKDSYSDRVQELQRKIVEHRASKAETKEIQRGARYLMKVADLRMAVLDISSKAHTSNFNVQTATLQTMLWTSTLVQVRRATGSEIDADDYARVKRNLERVRRAEAIAASMMGMLAAFQAVLNQGGDPKALDAIAESTLEAFPFKPSVSDEEARKYVDEFSDNVGAHKATYEQMMRKAYGDARYEKRYKAQIDAMFRQVEDAQRQVPPQAAPPSATAGVDPNRLVPAQVNRRLGQAEQGIGVANAVKNGDASGALDGAAKMFPSDSTIGSSLAGLSALSKGDPKGAFDAAMNLVPGGPVKQGLGFAASLLFGSSKKG